MTISFEKIPANVKTPGAYVEIDPSNAEQGPGVQEYVGLIIAQRLSGGSGAAGSRYLITSPDQAIDLGGRGSMAARMADAWFANNQVNRVYLHLLDDVGAGTAATADLTVTAAATATGTLALYVCGKRVPVAVAAGDAVGTIAAAISAAINADADLPCTATVSTATVTITARHKGLVGNSIDIRVNHGGEFLPAGVTLSSTQFVLAGGATNPDLDDVWAAIGDTQYHAIACPYNDTTNLDSSLDVELERKWGPMVRADGFALVAKRAAHASLVSYGGSRNSKHFSVLGYDGPEAEDTASARLAAVLALSAQNDPALPFETVRLVGFAVPSEDERFTRAERDQQLNSGISTFVVVGGQVQIERLITCNQTTATGAPTEAFLDVGTRLTSAFMAWDFRTDARTKFARSKLAKDGTRYGAGQKIVTPAIGRAFAIGKAVQWEERGLLEDSDQFAKDLVVEINASDPTRLDFLLPPNITNGLMVVAASLQFRR